MRGVKQDLNAIVDIDQQASTPSRRDHACKLAMAKKYTYQTIEHDDMRRHIATGKQCIGLAMTWRARIAFMLTSGELSQMLADLVEVPGGQANAQADLMQLAARVAA